MYKDKAISVGTFLGGPLVSGYFFAENFKAIGQSDKITKTWIIAILTTIVVFGTAFLIPENSRFPRFLIPAIYTAIASGLFKKYQEPDILNEIEGTVEYHHWGRTIGVSLIGLVITLAIIFISVFAFIGIEESNIATKKYGLTVKHQIEYNASDFTEVEIDQIADGFIEYAFFDLDTAKYVYVEKKGDTYVLFIPISELYVQDSDTIKELNTLRDKMDAYITNKTIVIKLVIDSLDNVVKTID